MNYLNLRNDNFWRFYHVISFFWKGFAEHEAWVLVGREINLHWPSKERPLQVFGLLSSKTFGNHSLKLSSKRCAQSSAAESEVMGEDPDHAPEGSMSFVVPASVQPSCVSLGDSATWWRMCRGCVSKQPQTSSQRGGKLCGPNMYRTVPSCTMQGLLGSVEELIKGQTSF